MFRSTDFYIDLGTANTLIYARRRGFLLNEPSVVALRQKSAGQPELFALGAPAKKMIGKAPERLSVLRPLREGVISDFDNTARMLHAFLKRIKENVHWFRPRMLISLPCEVTRFERRAVEEVGFELGARTVSLLDEPVAAAVGAGLPVLSNRGQMVVDIGGGTTEIAVISLGGIVTSRAVRVGGDDIDEAIIALMRSKYHFVIGEQTAERIKMAVASAFADEKDQRSIQVGGFDLLRGLPSKRTVDTRGIFPAIDSVVGGFAVTVRKALESCPPEIAADIAESGITLAGGGAMLRGISDRLSHELGVKVQIARDPLMSVAMGGAKALEDDRLFDALERPA
ncbi:MAG TPA: rod shape-determining protein [Bdellovibrionales bacterium]|nr:rod shape-determining protein [Bdellovibrionales bacterium]